MLTLNDGRNELWQWDTGRKLTVDADCSQVHFSNKVFGRSIDVDVVDGVAVIPDILLQTDKDLNVWAFVGTPENGYTKISKVFKVNKRNKPADYVFTPPEQTTLEEIKEKLDYLESIQDPDAIKNAVDDYLANNPIMVKETDPTVPEWAKQPTPPDVKIPDKLPNPHSITFTGAVDASYDGSNPVEIKIPYSDSNAESDVLCVTVDGNIADKTVTEIYEAYRAGKAVVCHVIDLDGNFVTNLVVCTSDIACFSASVGDVVITVMLTENGVQMEFTDILTESELPEISGGGISVTGAEVGQTVRIAEVDENGVPTAWESVDFPSGGSGGSSGWELIGEATSDGAGDATGIYVPIDFTQYSEVFVKARTVGGEACRIVLSSFLAWYNGTVVALNHYGNTPATVPTLIQVIIKNIDGVLYPFASHSSGNSNIEAYMEAMFTANSTATNFAATTTKYIRCDANNAVVSEGVTLTVYGRR